MEFTLTLCNIVHVLLTGIALILVIGFIVISPTEKIVAIGCFIVLGIGSYYVFKTTEPIPSPVIIGLGIGAIVAGIASFSAYMVSPCGVFGVGGFLLSAVIGVGLALYAINSQEVIACIPFL